MVVNDLGATLDGAGGEQAPADQVVDEIKKAGGTAQANYGSVSDFAQGTAMVEQVVKAWGRIDILVHVAGILRDRMIFNMTEAEWDAVIAVHLKGAFNTIRAASIHMREHKRGRIISMSSVSALGAPGQPNYAAAKAGIIGLTWSTANAMAKYGVTCNAIMPSGATRMIDSTPRGREVFESTGKWPSEQAVGTERDPDNVAPLVVYLSSRRRPRQRAGLPLLRLRLHGALASSGHAPARGQSPPDAGGGGGDVQGRRSAATSRRRWAPASDGRSTSGRPASGRISARV